MARLGPLCFVMLTLSMITSSDSTGDGGPGHPASSSDKLSSPSEVRQAQKDPDYDHAQGKKVSRMVSHSKPKWLDRQILADKRHKDETQSPTTGQTIAYRYIVNHKYHVYLGAKERVPFSNYYEPVLCDGATSVANSSMLFKIAMDSTKHRKQGHPVPVSIYNEAAESYLLPNTRATGVFTASGKVQLRKTLSNVITETSMDGQTKIARLVERDIEGKDLWPFKWKLVSLKGGDVAIRNDYVKKGTDFCYLGIGYNAKGHLTPKYFSASEMELHDTFQVRSFRWTLVDASPLR